MATRELIQALAATAELCGAKITDVAARMLVSDLEAYPEEQVFAALAKVRRSSKRFSLGAIIEAIGEQDGRPGADEAWAMLPKSEAQSVVWTREMAQAAALALPLLDEDKFSARRAFVEAYEKLCSDARDKGEVVRWEPSLGHDAAGRTHAVQEAVDKGRLPKAALAGLLPSPDMTQGPIAGLLTGSVQPLPDGEDAPLPREELLARLEELRKSLGAHNRRA